MSASAVTAADIVRELEELGDPEDASFLQRFFKTGPGQYGEGDRFLGIRVPAVRKLARRYRSLPLSECRELLQSEYHEARLLALVILVDAYERGDGSTKNEICQAYLENADHVNNWDLVDASAPRILGPHLESRDRSLLLELAASESLWERRIAMLATAHFIKNGEYDDALRVADVLLSDPHDLIHKAVGWMLREIGKRDQEAEEAFLRPRYSRMPRTMLRYAIERFPEPLRQQYLRGEI